MLVRAEIQVERELSDFVYLSKEGYVLEGINDAGEVLIDSDNSIAETIDDVNEMIKELMEVACVVVTKDMEMEAMLLSTFIKQKDRLVIQRENKGMSLRDFTKYKRAVDAINDELRELGLWK